MLTSGFASSRPNKGWALSASICAAMEGFIRAMTMELAPIRVNKVSPSMVKTALWGVMPNIDREAMYTNVGNTMLAKRVGEVADIAQTFILLNGTRLWNWTDAYSCWWNFVSLTYFIK